MSTRNLLALIATSQMNVDAYVKSSKEVILVDLRTSIENLIAVYNIESNASLMLADRAKITPYIDRIDHCLLEMRFEGGDTDDVNVPVRALNRYLSVTGPTKRMAVGRSLL